ncbi:MAG TPA: imidazole glycerol phosphate synthase subunit HisF [Pseudogracilibacillus sp.]|nr:imidazole glycerol phosphate synthase subunit HisF [Pseudogracilibacillus sp.]
MSNKRIVPCLDVDGGRVVKGKKFKDIQDVADPMELAKYYDQSGADELVFYDIAASQESRSVFIDTIKALKEVVSIPLTVGGGIRTLEDIEKIFAVGVDKVSINSAALSNPLLIQEAANTFGSEKVVLSMDVKQVSEGTWEVYSRGGKKTTEMDAIEWAKRGEQLGAGEIVLNSIDGDGAKDGYSIELTKAVSEAVNIPVVASGGAGKKEHFLEVLTEGKADAALAASVFHYKEILIEDLKKYLNSNI